MLTPIMKIATAYLLSCMLASLPLFNLAPCYGETEGDSVQGGAIVISKELAGRIADIENLLRSDPDMKAERQAALLIWLADLYDSTLQFKEVEKCYAKILSFFPYDVGTLNRFARFLLERRDDVDNALSHLKKALYYSKFTDAKALERGRTELMLGKVDMRHSHPDSAEEHFRQSANLFEENTNLQITALSALHQALFQSQKYDKALSIYLKLVGKKRAFDEKDIEKINLLIKLSRDHADEDAKALASRAIEEERELSKKRVEQLGATLESIPSADGYNLEAVFYKRARDGGVLLVPSHGNDRSSYRVLSQLLASSETSCLIMESRSALPTLPPSSSLEISEDEDAFSKQSGDIYAGVEFLKGELGTDEGKIIIVTAARSSEIVERAIYRYKLPCPVLYLSPIFNNNDRGLINRLAFRKERPSYVIYSLEDRLSLLSVSFFRKTKPIKTLDVLPLEKAGHGEEMLQLSPEALKASYNWIEKTLSPDSK